MREHRRLWLILTGVVACLPECILGSLTWNYNQQGADWTMGDCTSAERQSPINIASQHTTALDEPFRYNYETKGGKISLINNGHTLEVIGQQALGHLDYRGNVYRLEQIHFHAPSEHTFENQARELEMHLLHMNDDHGLMVVSLTFSSVGASAAHPFLTVLEAKGFPSENGRVEINMEGGDEFNLNTLISDTEDFYKYAGSLTTPPCTENAQWFVMAQPLLAKASQLELFTKAFAYPGTQGNFRIIQNTPDLMKNPQHVTRVKSTYSPDDPALQIQQDTTGETIKQELTGLGTTGMIVLVIGSILILAGVVTLSLACIINHCKRARLEAEEEDYGPTRTLQGSYQNYAASLNAPTVPVNYNMPGAGPPGQPAPPPPPPLAPAAAAAASEAN
ncbi:unnamed protein product [Vitrella brassicaformis CCMP3155]|uniref:carbonic anhydrase n=2 Tax=Vitrella brassicaformis TaxID=1169539 RepID=A0A0G4F4I1_VITBC|nr:unnamed protein product [Vitrella brassicaformis CCMP3155]|eukprot:CEM06956.1 unnamed protein product [Vitrella brassicaformis CCMP3155]